MSNLNYLSSKAPIDISAVVSSINEDMKDVLVASLGMGCEIILKFPTGRKHSLWVLKRRISRSHFRCSFPLSTWLDRRLNKAMCKALRSPVWTDDGVEGTLPMEEPGTLSEYLKATYDKYEHEGVALGRQNFAIMVSHGCNHVGLDIPPEWNE